MTCGGSPNLDGCIVESIHPLAQVFEKGKLRRKLGTVRVEASNGNEEDLTRQSRAQPGPG